MDHEFGDGCQHRHADTINQKHLVQSFTGGHDGGGEDCNRVDPDNGDYGYCPDCDSHYSEDEIEDLKEEAKDECLNDVIGQIEAGDIKDSTLRKAVEKYNKQEGDGNA